MGSSSTMHNILNIWINISSQKIFMDNAQCHPLHTHTYTHIYIYIYNIIQMHGVLLELANYIVL